MKYVIAIILALGSIEAQATEYHPTFMYAYDGDTLTVTIDGKKEHIRLADVDTAEIKGKCPAEKDLALRAKEFTTTWAQRSEIILTTGKREREKYGRLLGTVTNSEGESLGDKLIEAGLAVKWEGHRNRHWCDNSTEFK